MTLRRLFAALFVAILATSGPAIAATVTTTNFVVTAPDKDLARRFADQAEKFRTEKALQWLGQEMPPWSQPCPLRVNITQNGGGGGETSFSFGYDGNRPVVRSQQMSIHGPVRQLLESVLPHEITHTVLAYHFGRPVPRWADEGGSVLSENNEERFNHDVKNREYLNAGRGIRLLVLFPLAEYPRDMHVLYAQGYSVSAYLVERGGGGLAGRTKLLQFLTIGMRSDNPRAHGTPATWNAAVQQVYGFESVDELEKAWLDHLRDPQPRIAARNTGAATGTPTSAGKAASYVSTAPGRTDTRSSAPPALPILEAPIRAVRGVAPDDEPIRGASPSPVKRVVPVPAPAQPIPAEPILLPPEIPPPDH